MYLEKIDFTKTLSDDQVYESIMNNYSKLSKEWIEVFKKSSKMLRGERLQYDDSNVLEKIFQNKE